MVEFAREDSWPWKEMENLNRPITVKRVNRVIKNFQHSEVKVKVTQLRPT